MGLWMWLGLGFILEFEVRVVGDRVVRVVRDNYRAFCSCGLVSSCFDLVLTRFCVKLEFCLGFS